MTWGMNPVLHSCGQLKIRTIRLWVFLLLINLVMALPSGLAAFHAGSWAWKVESWLWISPYGHSILVRGLEASLYTILSLIGTSRFQGSKDLSDISMDFQTQVSRDYIYQPTNALDLGSDSSDQRIPQPTNQCTRLESSNSGVQGIHLPTNQPNIAIYISQGQNKHLQKSSLKNRIYYACWYCWFIMPVDNISIFMLHSKCRFHWNFVSWKDLAGVTEHINNSFLQHTINICEVYIPRRYVQWNELKK